jgi:hypothetical protein
MLFNFKESVTARFREQDIAFFTAICGRSMFILTPYIIFGRDHLFEKFITNRISRNPVV